LDNGGGYLCHSYSHRSRHNDRFDFHTAGKVVVTSRIDEGEKTHLREFAESYGHTLV
jgi:hypothetical protein